MKILISKDGQELGPYSLVEVEKMVEGGTLQLDDLAKYEGRSGWVRLSKLPGFFFRPAYVPIPSETRALKIFITRNGQKLGPCSLEYLQDMINAGTVHLHDLARYEGQSDWVRLEELPGFFTRPTPITPRAKRPVLVWIISVFFFVVPSIALVVLAWKLLLTLTGTSVQSEAQRGHLGFSLWLNYGVPAVMCFVHLAFADRLFRLRRQALPIYIVSLALNPFSLLVCIPALNTGVIENEIVEFLFAWAINITILYYVWHLFKKGVLR